MNRLDQDERFRQEILEAFDAGLRDIYSEVDKVDVLVSINSFSFHFTNNISPRPSPESEEVQQQLCVLWSMFLETAKILEDGNPFQEKLLSLLLWTKEFDSLHRNIHCTETVACVWDLYRFGESLQATWEDVIETGTTSQQCNLASFSAKLLSMGVCRDEISLIALRYLREALETDEEAKTIALLPAAAVWIDGSRHTLLAFSVENRFYGEKFKVHLATPGELARGADISQQGFSLKRWLFWRERLKKLSHGRDSTAAKAAKKAFISMVSCGRELDYDIPCEARLAEKLQVAMAAALSKSGKESINDDYIAINTNWMD
ncbi:hypothetical protein DTO271G3_185 [Paecilomyces variotii]|nr:hypothetical protein DTO271G3_185 [Paecilomyces variotii]